MDRFRGNEKMMMHFLLDFSKDPSYETYKAAMTEKRYEDAFRAIHTLKGVWGNLSLDNLYDVTSNVVELFRAGQNAKVEEVFPEVVKEYERVVKILDSLE